MKDRSHEVLPKVLLDEIGTAATVRAFPKHAVIVTESDATDTIYVMLAGKARVYVSDEKGREVVLNQLGRASTSARSPWTAGRARRR
jgi:CRP/FNR family cyclic AMP-dependent transcriptional regulator